LFSWNFFFIFLSCVALASKIKQILSTQFMMNILVG
jgi:hypothetical protein